MIGELRKTNDRALGVLQTTWCDFGAFIRAYYAQEKSGDSGLPDRRGRQSGNANGAARCFRTLFAAIRGEKPK